MNQQKILFLGDLFYDYEYVAEDIEMLSKWIRSENYLTIVNLEGGIQCDVEAPIRKRGPNLSSSLTIIDVLKKLNVVGVCLANNHTMDFGNNGLSRTIVLLNEHQIQHVGAGSTLSEAVAPMILTVDEQKIAVLNYGWDVEETVYAASASPGCAPRDEKLICKQIAALKKEYEQIIVCMHWGFEYNRLPMPYDIDLGHKMIDAGASLIIGHHPHCIQASENYRGKKIYYSLGNFYFGSQRKEYTTQFHEPIRNQSDYGLMVIYDLAHKTCIEKAIYFDHRKNASEIYETVSEELMEDISGIDWAGNAYMNRIRKGKRNINPVLTCNQWVNRISLAGLYAFYSLKSVVKKIVGKGKR